VFNVRNDVRVRRNKPTYAPVINRVFCLSLCLNAFIHVHNTLLCFTHCMIRACIDTAPVDVHNDTVTPRPRHSPRARLLRVYDVWLQMNIVRCLNGKLRSAIGRVAQRTVAVYGETTSGVRVPAYRGGWRSRALNVKNGVQYGHARELY